MLTPRISIRSSTHLQIRKRGHRSVYVMITWIKTDKPAIKARICSLQSQLLDHYIILTLNKHTETRRREYAANNMNICQLFNDPISVFFCIFFICYYEDITFVKKTFTQLQGQRHKSLMLFGVFLFF